MWMTKLCEIYLDERILLCAQRLQREEHAAPIQKIRLLPDRKSNEEWDMVDQHAKREQIDIL